MFCACLPRTSSAHLQHQNGTSITSHDHKPHDTDTSACAYGCGSLKARHAGWDGENTSNIQVVGKARGSISGEEEAREMREGKWITAKEAKRRDCEGDQEWSEPARWR